MPPNAAATQAVQEEARESRTDKVAIAVTASEKRAIRVIAGIRETDESNLCRTTPVAEIVAAFERIQSASVE